MSPINMNTRKRLFGLKRPPKLSKEIRIGWWMVDLINGPAAYNPDCEFQINFSYTGTRRWKGDMENFHEGYMVGFGFELEPESPASNYGNWLFLGVAGQYDTAEPGKVKYVPCIWHIVDQTNDPKEAGFEWYQNSPNHYLTNVTDRYGRYLPPTFGSLTQTDMHPSKIHAMRLKTRSNGKVDLAIKRNVDEDHIIDFANSDTYDYKVTDVSTGADTSQYNIIDTGVLSGRFGLFTINNRQDGTTWLNQRQNGGAFIVHQYEVYQN